MKNNYVFKSIVTGICFMLIAMYTVSAQDETSAPIVLESLTTAETDAANPDAVDEDPNDVQVLKTDDGSGDRESYVKFDISEIDTENLSYVTLTLLGGQHNDEADLINPYYVEMYTCENTTWSREELTWNTASSFTIGDNPLTMANMQGFGTYRFYSPELTQYIIDQKKDGAEYVAFKFKAKDSQPFDTWLSGAWKGMKLKLAYSTPTNVIQSETTAETDEANPDQIDKDVDPNDIQVWKKEGSNRESYVMFDISAVDTDFLKYAVISCLGAQHNGDAEMADPNWVQIHSCENTDWSRDDLTWNIAKDFTIGEEPLAYANIMDFKRYNFYSKAITDYIKAQKDAGADHVAFKLVAQEAQPFDTWLSGKWMGFELRLYEGDVNAEPIKDLETGEASAAAPNSLDTDPNDLMVQKNDEPASESLYRAINLNGDPVTIGGIDFDGGSASDFSHNTDGGVYSGRATPVPAVEANKEAMLKSFMWGKNSSATFSSVPEGDYSIYVYVFEDNDDLPIDASITINGNVVESGFTTSSAGEWTKLGPYNMSITDGNINFEFNSEEALNISGFEIYSSTTATGGYESFVTFDVKDIEEGYLTYAEIAFKAGQHNPEGVDPLNKYIVDLLPMQDYSWTAADITWDTTRYFTSMYTPIASANVWAFDEYTFSGAALAGYINSQIAADADTIAFKLVAREAADWDVWIGGNWEGLHLSYAQKRTGEEIIAPVFSVEGGTFETSPELTLATDTEGATIYYTLDGTIPTSESTEYTGAITLSDGTTEIKAIAIKEGSKSLISAETFVIGSQEPFSGTPISLPGTVQAEDFDKGAMGIAYLEHEEENRMDGNPQYSDYRADAPTVEIASLEDSEDKHLAYQTDEWYEYTVNNTIETAYKVTIRYSMAQGFEREVSIELYDEEGNKEVLIDKVLIEGTGIDENDWETFEEKELGVTQDIAAGKYELRYIFGSGYNLDWISFQPATSVKKLTALSGIKAYPNPVKNMLNLSFNAHGNYMSNIEVMDITGQVRMSLTKSIKPGNNQFVINTESLNNGLYFIRMSMDKKCHTVKIVVNR